MSQPLEGGPVETLQRIPMSWEDYLRTPEHPKHEWVGGVCVVSPLAIYAHRSVVRRLLFDESTPVLVAEVLSPSTRAEDTMRKSREYAEGGIDQYWVVDPELRRIDVFVNREGEWEPALHLDDAAPTGTVAVGPHGEVTVDLTDVLD